jgi:transcriptional regulator with XRE-family HTH domain
VELKQKLKLIIKTSGLTYAKFADLTSISLSSLKKYAGGESDAPFKVILKITASFPQYALWLTTNNVAPEVGQISPDIEMPQLMSVGIPHEIVDKAFDKTMETSLMLGWLTPKEGIEFSMLADLHRHNFVEAGGVLLEPKSTQEQHKAG